MGWSPSEQWFHVRHNKHNQWMLDEPQIYQYHLGGAMHSHIRWWEAMDIPRRSVPFIQFGDEITVSILVCEDLAYSDGVSEGVRSVGPTIALTLLLDGPQLTSRWAARYASVLADNPGSAVLTLTSLGRAQCSRPRERAASPVVALWKDPLRGTREIPLEAGAAHGILLTACADQTTRRTRDGRLPVDNAIDFFDVGVHQVRAAITNSGKSASRPVSSRQPALDVAELTIVTAWTEAVAEALAHDPDGLDAVLADAHPDAAWRDTMQLVEPSPNLRRAFATLERVIREASTPDHPPSVDALLATVSDSPSGEQGAETLARRVLRSVLETRLTHPTMRP